MFTIHGTKKLRDKVKQPLVEPANSGLNVFGDWYATALFWKPQLALFVNEQTLLPVLLPLAPAKTVGPRFPAALAEVLRALNVSERFIDNELESMGSAAFAKTANRSVVGAMVEFEFMLGHYAAGDFADRLVELSIRLANTPCGPLEGLDVHPFPDKVTWAAVVRWEMGLPPEPRV